MKSSFLYLLFFFSSFAVLSSQNISTAFTVSNAIEIDLNKNYIFPLGYDGDNKVFARKFDKSKDDITEWLLFDTSFSLINRVSREIDLKVKSKKLESITTMASKYGIDEIFIENDNSDDKLAFYIKSWDSNLKLIKDLSELGSLPIVKKRFQASKMSGHGTIKAEYSPDHTKVLIVYYNTAPKDEDRSVYYIMVDAATKKSYTKTFKLQEKGSDYPQLHLSNVIDNNGVAYITIGDMKDKGLHFTSFLRDDKMPDFRNLKFLRHDFINENTRIIPLNLEDRQYFRFDMYIDKSGDVIATGLCTKNPKRDNDDNFYIRYDPIKDKLKAKNITQLPFLMPYGGYMYSMFKPSYMDLLTSQPDLIFLEDGSCVYLYQPMAGVGSHKDGISGQKAIITIKDFLIVKIDSIGNKEWESMLPYKIERTGGVRPAAFLRPANKDNHVVFFYDDEDKNKDVYDVKQKVHYYTENEKTRMLMMLSFDGKGRIKKEEVRLEYKKERLQHTDFSYHLSPSMYYFPMKEGKKTVFGKLSVFSR